MRLHIYDYNPFKPVRITLDGKPVSYCIFADEEAGFVDYYVTDGEGDIVITNDEHGNREPQVERLFGQVVIDVTDSQRAALIAHQQQRDDYHAIGASIQRLRESYEEAFGDDIDAELQKGYQ